MNPSFFAAAAAKSVESLRGAWHSGPMDTYELKNFVNGRETEPSGDERLELVDPSTERVYGTTPISSAGEIEAAYSAASDASWFSQ